MLRYIQTAGICAERVVSAANNTWRSLALWMLAAFGLLVIQSADAFVLSSVTSRVHSQEALFERLARSDADASPEANSGSTDDAIRSSLNDRSIAASEKQNRIDQSVYGALDAISTLGFPTQDRLSHDVMLYDLRQRLEDFRLKLFEIAVTEASGVHLDMARLPNESSFDTVRHVDDYVRRLKLVPKAFQQTLAVLRRGLADGLTPPRVLLTNVPKQCADIILRNPFDNDVRFSASISLHDQALLRVEIRRAVEKGVLPAYSGFEAYIAHTYLPKARVAVGEAALPEGARRYQNEIRRQTTTNLSAGKIHELGLREVARITIELQAIASKAGYHSLNAYRAALRSDPRYVPASAEQIVADFREYVEQMRPKLPQLFDQVPDTRMVVEAMPPTERPNITHHVDGSADGSIPGRVDVATSNFSQRSLIGDETIAYHEGLPGHELQISIQQKLDKLPPFRRVRRDNAYVEGWAVYAEALGKEVGFFTTPAADYGRLNTELVRAVRLVADTGLNRDGWSIARTKAYLRSTGALDGPTIDAEVDRYIRWPAQGLGYKIGQLAILRLRRAAQQRLGSRFDIRAFHTAVLRDGSLPLGILRAEVLTWAKDRAAQQ